MMPAAMMSAMSSGMPAGAGGSGGGGFLDFMEKMQDPFAVLKDSNASGLDKLMAVLLSTKVQAQSGGSSFGFAGPGAGSQGQLAAMMRKIKSGMDQSPVLTPVDRKPMAVGPNLPLRPMSLPLAFDPAGMGGLR